MTALTKPDQLPLSEELAPVTDPAANVLGALISLADSGKLTAENTAAIEKLTDLYERMQDRNARQQFNVAMAKFQAECPKIPRTKAVDFVTKQGAHVKYNSFDITVLTDTVDGPLRKHGLSYTWDSAPIEGGKFLNVTCVLRHVAGHSERASFPVPVEQQARMNAAQSMESADTYGMRRSLLKVLGIGWMDPDPEDAEEAEKLAEHQVKELAKLIQDGKLDSVRLYGFLGISSLYDVPAVRFDEVKQLIADKAEQIKAKGRA